MAGLIGLDKVLKNMNILIDAMEGRNIKGMIKASIVVQRAMDRETPKVPWDTGNLHASWFVVTSKGGTPKGRSPKFKGKDASIMSSDHSQSINHNKSIAKGSELPGIIMGFSANYAWFVHEMIGVSDIKTGKGKEQISPLSQRQRQALGVARFKRPGSGPKFFEAAIKRNAGKILKIIADEAKII
jgi:hypothetical protein